MGADLRYQDNTLATVSVNIHPPVPAPIENQGYNLVFQDDFEELNTDIWQPLPWNRLPMPPDHATVENSILTVRSRDVASIGPRGTGRPWHPDALVFKHGYFEARMRYTNHIRARPAFWMLNHETVNCWPELRNCATLNAEWDIIEPGLGNGTPDTRAYMVLHRNTNHTCNIPDEGINTSINGTGFSNWHTWAGLWTETSATAYLDGVSYGTRPVYDSFDQDMYIIFNMRPNPEGTEPLPPVFEMQVDWVRVWQK